MAIIKDRSEVVADMIPILYESTETQFVNNGLGRLRDATRVECTEERNGIYEVEFDYPVDGAHFDEIIIINFIVSHKFLFVFIISIKI